MANVPLSETLRKRVGEVLADYIEAGRQQLGDAPGWWQRCREVHMGDPVAAMRALAGQYGSPKVHMPLSQPRQDALVDQICAVVAKQSPLMLDTSDEDEIATAKAEIVHRVWEDAKFGERFRTALDVATDTDIAFLRLCPLGDGRAEISVHEPIDVVVWPALPSGWDDVTICGHKVYKRRRDVIIAKEDKRYYRKDALDKGQSLPESNPGNDEDRHESYDRSGITEAAGPLPNLDELVELWDVVVLLDLSKLKKLDEKDVTEEGQRFYRATVSKDDRQLLALEEYPYSTPWYFRVNLLSQSEFYPARSLARNLYPVQQTYDYLWTAAYEGAMTAAKPPIFGGTLKDEQYTKWSFGDYIQRDGGEGNEWSPPVRADLSGLFPLIQECKKEADKIANISDNTTGGKGSDTATEASIIASGVAVGIEGRIENATHDLGRMAALTMEIVVGDLDAFSERFNIVPPPPPMPVMPLGMPMAPPVMV